MDDNSFRKDDDEIVEYRDIDINMNAINMNDDNPALSNNETVDAAISVAHLVPIVSNNETVDAVAVVPNDETVSNNPVDAIVVVPNDETVDAPDAVPPLAVDQPLMGSSRISGGFIRGRAQGNVPNHADFATTSLDLANPVLVEVKGEVFLYLTDLYPRDVKFDVLKGESDLVVMVKVVETMAPILERVARKCSIIKGSCILRF